MGRAPPAPPPRPPGPSVRSGEVVAVLGSVLEGGQLGHVWEVLLSRPRRRQDGEQPLEVVGKHLRQDRAQGHGLGTGHASRQGDKEVTPGESGGVARPGYSER